MRKIGIQSDLWFLKWLIIGACIRLLLMPIAVHVDLVSWSWFAHFVALGHLNIYQYAFENYPAIAASVDAPPLYYLAAGFWEYLLSALGLLNIDSWGYPWGIPNINRSIFLFKVPYLFLDLLSGYIIIKLFGNNADKRIAFMLWILNPVVIYTSYLFGQIDIIPTFFVILGLYYAKAGQEYSAAGLDDQINLAAVVSVLAFGLGGCFKNYPLLLLPIAIIVFGDGNLRKSITLTVFGFCPYLITMVPFIKSTTSFLLGGGSLYILDFSYEVGVTKIFVFILGYFSILFYLLYIEDERSFCTIWRYCFAVLTLIYVSSLWLPQWYVWIMPFIILAIVQNYKLLKFYVLQIAFFSFYILWWGNSLGAGLFTETISPIFWKFAGMNDIISLVFSYYELLAISYSIFIVASVGMVYLAFKNVSNDQLRPSKFALLLPLLVFFITLALTIVLGGYGYTDVAQEQVTQTVGEIIEGDSFGQYFVCSSDILRAIAVKFATYNRLNTNDVIFHLRSSPSTEDIVTITANSANIADNRYHLFSFPPISDSKDKQYYFFIDSPSSVPGNAITIWSSEVDIYKDGSAYKNHVPIEGDLSFKTFTKMSISDIGLVFIESYMQQIRQDKPFFVLYGFLMIILISTIILITFRKEFTEDFEKPL